MQKLWLSEVLYINWDQNSSVNSVPAILKVRWTCQAKERCMWTLNSDIVKNPRSDLVEIKPYKILFSCLSFIVAIWDKYGLNQSSINREMGIKTDR